MALELDNAQVSIPIPHQHSTLRRDEIQEYVHVAAVSRLYSLIADPGSEIARGVRGTNLLSSRPDRLLDSLAVHVEPQSSTELEYNADRLYHVFVLKCENDLALAVINGAKIDLRSGDHLILNPDTKFQFINSSLTHTLKLRILYKVRDSKVVS
jgi:hypothetical protein